MEVKKINLGEVAVGAGKNAKAFLGKTKDTIIKAVDQNGDGSFDFQDVSAMADSIGNAAQNAANAMRDNAEARNREKERKALQPIFLEDLDSAEFTLSKLIRVADIDKKHAESEVCKGSAGFVSEQRELRIVNIYKNMIDAFGISLYPDADSEIYYIDPSDRNKYIALDDYFGYLKIARVNELQKIAQDLGAKHFRVTYREKKASITRNDMKAKGNVRAGAAEAERNLSVSDNSNIEVAAEMQCLGHAPIEPKLFYLRGEPSIQSLIALRMDENSPIFHQEFSLKLSNSSGIKEKDAVKIDAALKAMKISGNTTVVSEAQSESRRFFEYEVDF
ncbi:MAG TPA: hypothetical protein DDY90_02300 [Clostridiales bacterium]|nr:hypothetical protein [Clostridiales bacterium]HCP71104.1 hypothetical protein [Clostridiales bacterium]